MCMLLLTGEINQAEPMEAQTLKEFSIFKLKLTKVLYIKLNRYL